MSIGGWCRAKSWQMTCFMNKKTVKYQQNGAQNAPKSTYNNPKVIFFLGLLGCYKHFFIIFARKKQ